MRNLVIAYLKQDMRDTALLPVHGDRVIGAIVDRVRLVVSRSDPRILGNEGIHEATRETLIAVGADAKLPRAVAAAKERREAVHRDENRRSRVARP